MVLVLQYSTQYIQYWYFSTADRTCSTVQYKHCITYISVHPPVHTWADKSNKLIASLVDNKAAHLALVALLAKSPEKIISMEYIIILYHFLYETLLNLLFGTK